jgi:DNA-binding transcriptional LysR family regulator
MNRTEDLRVFALVAKTMSFTKAAQQLGASRSVISKRITQLEDRLGARLLNRTTRRLSLTEAGQTFFGHCADILTAVDEAESVIKEMHMRPSGLLKISAPVFLGQLLMPPLVEDMLKRYPDLSLDLQLEDEFVDVVGNGYDAVVRVGVLADSSLVARRLATTRLVACASPKYLQRHGVPSKPEDLLQHDCIMLTTPDSQFQLWRFHGPRGPLSIRVPTRFRSNNDFSLKEAVILGHGIAYIPTFMVNRDIQTGRLQTVLDRYCQEERGIYVLYPQQRKLPLKVKLFVDTVSKRIKELDLTL